jgi:hypothetical protein
VEISILLCWFALVDRVGSWLYCIGKDILYKKSLLGFLPCEEGFPRINLGRSNKVFAQTTFVCNYSQAYVDAKLVH